MVAADLLVSPAAVVFPPGWVSKEAVAATQEVPVLRFRLACALCPPKNSAMRLAIMLRYSSMNSTRPIRKGNGLKRFAIIHLVLHRSHRASQVFLGCSRVELPVLSAEANPAEQGVSV